LFGNHLKSSARNNFNEEEDTWLAYQLYQLRNGGALPDLDFKLPPRRLMHAFSAETMLYNPALVEESPGVVQTSSNRSSNDGDGDDDRGSISGRAENLNTIQIPVFMHAPWRYIDAAALIPLLSSSQKFWPHC
jgi:hypothetical protein